MQQGSARSESLAARLSILESTLQKQETELTRSHSELGVVKKENQELLAGCREATETLTKAEKMAEGIAKVQAELKEKESEVDRLEAQLQQETEIAELQTRIQPQVAAPVATGPSELHGKEYTTFTRVEEGSWIHVRQIVNDLDSTKAELTMLQAVLNGKEKQIEEVNKYCQSMTDKPAENGKELIEEQQRRLQRLFPQCQCRNNVDAERLGSLI